MFIKYGSIKNDYLGYNRQLDKCPELFNAKFILQEKIHGCNLQFIFEPQKDIVIASRNQVIGYYPNNIGTFFGLQSILPQYKGLLEKLSEFCDKLNRKVNVYCEFFGNGIQKEVYYGPSKYIRVFDILVDDDLSPKEIQEMFQEWGFEHLLVPTIKYIKGIENCMLFDTKINTTLSVRNNNTMEGVVIKPYEGRYGTEFYLKKKNIAFLERKKKKKLKKFNPENQEIQEELKKYITKARMWNIFSNYGCIEDISQLGKFIKLILEDAKKDFLEENDFECTKENKRAFNVSKDIVDLLKEYLKS